MTTPASHPLRRVAMVGALLVLAVALAALVARGGTPLAWLSGGPAPLTFSATAYCKGSVTAAGTAPRSGVAASDPDVLPLGSVVRVASDLAAYDGIYTVLDTGPAIEGRELDLYIWSCTEALAFGRRDVDVTVLRLGWEPAASDAEEAHRQLLAQPTVP
ncbi:MAG: 3D domain-containing protein [Vicinamibacterales bacterium]